MDAHRHLPEPSSGSVPAILGRRLGHSGFSELSLAVRTLRPFWAMLLPLERCGCTMWGGGLLCASRT